MEYAVFGREACKVIFYQKYCICKITGKCHIQKIRETKCIYTRLYHNRERHLCPRVNRCLHPLTIERKRVGGEITKSLARHRWPATSSSLLCSRIWYLSYTLLCPCRTLRTVQPEAHQVGSPTILVLGVVDEIWDKTVSPAWETFIFVIWPSKDSRGMSSNGSFRVRDIFRDEKGIGTIRCLTPNIAHDLRSLNLS